MTQQNEEIAWSLYWSDDRLYSCVAQGSVEDQVVLDSLWKGFAKSLVADDRVLDLATGNGAVAQALMSANNNLQIDAVDKAAIDPKRYLSDNKRSDKVTFYADTDLMRLPFQLLSFDALTSQFGIEYAGFSKASNSVMDYLKPGGRFQFIVHNQQSEIVLSSKQKIVELEQLTRESGLIDTLISVLQGENEFAKLEELGKEYLAGRFERTQQISGQVFAGIARISENLSSQPKESFELGMTMSLRVRSELTRLQQLIAAAQSDSQMNGWLTQLASEGELDASYKPLYLDEAKQDYLLGWLVAGHKV